HAAPRVRPVVPSIFSPPHDHSENESFSEEVVGSPVPLQKSVSSEDDAKPPGTKSNINEETSEPVVVEGVVDIPARISADPASAQPARQRVEQSRTGVRQTRPAGKREAWHTYSEYIPLLPEVSAPPRSVQSDSHPIQSQKPVLQVRRDNF